MPLFPIELPPGVYRSGTQQQSQGRYYDADLVRWKDGALGPIGGWRTRTDETVTGKARRIISWPDNDGVSWSAIGTHSHLYALDRAGNLYDLTPDDYTVGNADATFRGGYGNWLYGRGAYGTPRPDTTTPRSPTVWSLDTWGENLVACADDDGVLYEWALDTAEVAVPIENAPTAHALHVTANRILMALGAQGNPRQIDWCDQEDNTDWTPSAVNYAGSFNLQSSGRLMAGRRVAGGELILTDADAWFAKFLGQPFVYGFTQKGSGCGLVAKGAVVAIDGDAVPIQAAWMSHQGFWGFNGYVQPVPCDVADHVFSDINRTQIGKVTAWYNSDFGEVTWFYPSASSTEIDRYVTWNIIEGHWTVGSSMDRLCGAAKGPMPFPLCVDAEGAIYEHEVGLDHGGAEPYAETGPFMIGQGDRVIDIDAIVPDERTTGDVTATLYLRDRPNSTTEYTKGPYALDDKVDVRFAGRMLRVRYTGARLADWRVGKFDLSGKPGAMR